MSITPAVEFDNSSGSVMGGVTLPDHTGTATHLLVFMLGGLYVCKLKPLCIYISFLSVSQSISITRNDITVEADCSLLLHL